MDFKTDFCNNVRLCENAMYALAFSILKNEDDTADAISESILKAYCHIGQLKNKQAFKPWILKIVHHTCIEMLRKNPSTLDIDEQYALADDASGKDLSTRFVLNEAVKKLRQPYQTVVILHYFENMSVSDIAKVTGSSVIAVKKQLSRAREMLRTSLNREDFF